LPNSDATKRKPDLRMHSDDATGTVSKYLILSDVTSSSSCSIVTLNRSPSSLCNRKKNAPCGRESERASAPSLEPASKRGGASETTKRRTLILCMTADVMMTSRFGSWSGCARRGIGMRCSRAPWCL